MTAATKEKAAAPAATKVANPTGLAAELRRLAASNLPIPAHVVEHMIVTFGLEEKPNGKTDDSGKKTAA